MSEMQRIRFGKGVVSDLSPIVVQPGSWVFPTENIRIINLEGKGFVVTPLNSNERVASLRGEFDTFSENVICLGAAAYKGVIYMALYDPDDDTSSIATYPSPRAIVDITGDVTEVDASMKGFKGFVNPLVNVKRQNGQVVVFRSGKLEFSPVNMVGFQFKESYDQSVDIYINDDLNTIRVINSGFDIEGTFLERYYSVIDSMDEKIASGFCNIIASLISPPALHFSQINSFGNLGPGTYYVFARYVTKEFNRTQFFAPMGPVMILAGNTPNDISGSPEYDYLSNQNFTEKAIEFTLSGDSQYDYYELAVVRYTQTENGGLLRDIYIIDQLYPIGQETGIIYGYEDKATFSQEEIVYSLDIETVAKSMTVIDSRLIIGGLKKMNIGNQPLIDFAQNVVPFTALEPIDDDADQLKTDYQGFRTYQKVEDVLDKMTYMPREMYPYGIMYLLKDNTMSEVFPTYGSYNNENSAEDNDKGLFMFGKCPGLNNKYKAGFFFMDNTPSDEIIDNAIGFYIVRGKRIDNYVANGILFPTMRGACLSGVGKYMNPGSLVHWKPQHQGGDMVYKYFGNYDVPDNAISVPLYAKVYWYHMPPGYEGYPFYGQACEYWPQTVVEPMGFPMGVKVTANNNDVYWYYDTPADSPNAQGSPCLTQGDYDFPPPYEGVDYGMFDKYRFALFSWDYLLSLQTINETEQYSLELASIYMENLEAEASCRPTHQYVKFRSGARREPVYTPVTAYNILEGINGYNGFGSLFKDGEVHQADAAFFKSYDATYYYSRSYHAPRYLGIKDAVTTFGQTPLLDLLTPDHHINLFQYFNATLRKSNPDVSFYNARVAGFSVAGTEYSIISDFIPFVYGQRLNTTVRCGHGDGFSSPAFFRPCVWDTLDANPEGENDPVDARDIRYAWGYMAGFRSRSLVCPAHRNRIQKMEPTEEGGQELITYNFFPRMIADGINFGDWILDNNDDYRYESFRINPGYSKTTPEVMGYGYDAQTPYSVYRRPVRLRFSDKAVPGSFSDGWRRFSIANFVDLDPKDGDITSIHNVFGSLVVVQERGVHIVPYGMKEMKIDNDMAKLTLGQSDYYLDPHTKILADFGSQHRFGAKITEEGLFGMDFNKSIIWGFTSEMKNLGKETLNETEISTVVDSFKEVIGFGTLPDRPVSGCGIVIGYDPAMSEVYFNIMYSRLGASSGDSSLIFTRMKSSFVFNAKSRHLVGNMSAITPVMIDVDKNFYLVQPDLSDSPQVIDDGIIFVKPGLYKADIKGHSLRFFDVDNTMSVSFIVNGLTSEKDMSTFEKIYEAHLLFSNDVAPYRIIYKTDYQEISKIFDVSDARFWEVPVYSENKWYVPVPVYTQSPNGEYSNYSELRGNWLRVTIEYRGTEPFVLGEVLSKFTPLEP